MTDEQIEGLLTFKPKATWYRDAYGEWVVFCRERLRAGSTEITRKDTSSQFVDLNGHATQCNGGWLHAVYLPIQYGEYDGEYDYSGPGDGWGF